MRLHNSAKPLLNGIMHRSYRSIRPTTGLIWGCKRARLHHPRLRLSLCHAISCTLTDWAIEKEEIECESFTTLPPDSVHIIRAASFAHYHGCEETIIATTPSKSTVDGRLRLVYFYYLASPFRVPHRLFIAYSLNHCISPCCIRRSQNIPCIAFNLPSL